MKKKETIADVIRRSIERELVKMEEHDGHIHNGWTGAALATWVYPGVVRSVRRYIKLNERRT